MKGRIKKILAVALMLCLSFTTVLSLPVAAEEDYGIMPAFNNVCYVTANGGVSDSGLLTVNYAYTGAKGITTKAVITTTIEKRFLGVFWQTVEINGANQWVQTIHSYSYILSKTYQLPSKGHYRVNITFKIYGTDGPADVINAPFEIPYD